MNKRGPQGFPVFMEISGKFESLKELKKVLRLKVKFLILIERVFKILSFKAEEKIVLYKVSRETLGLEKKLFFKDFLFKLDTLGFDYCPDFTGPFLRLDYLDQIPGEHLVVLHKPRPDKEDGFTFFVVEKLDNLWLGAIEIKPNEETRNFEFIVTAKESKK